MTRRAGWAGFWPLAALAAACLGGLLGLQWFDAQPAALRREWAAVVGSLRLHTSAYWGDGFDWGPRRLTMLVTHGFLHTGWLHLGVNMAMLAVLGAVAIRRVGPWRFLLLYLGAMPLAALAYAWARGPDATMVGASGAIHAVAGAVIAWAWRDGAGRPRRALAPLAWAAAILAANLWFWWLTGGRFAWQLHAAGLALGAAAAPFLPRRQQDAAPKGGA